MTEKLCLLRKEISRIPSPGITSVGHSRETFAPCIGLSCPMFVESGSSDSRNFCLLLLILDAHLTNLIYGNPLPEKKEIKPNLSFVQCKRCGGGYGHSDTGFCSVCQKFSAKETDSKK